MNIMGTYVEIEKPEGWDCEPEAKTIRRLMLNFRIGGETVVSLHFATEVFLESRLKVSASSDQNLMVDGKKIRMGTSARVHENAKLVVEESGTIRINNP